MTDTERVQEEALRRELMGEGSADTYRKNYLIEAGAGAGKTHTMVNRVVNQLLTGAAQPEELAVITFTEKATQELLERIDAELAQRLESAEAPDKPRIRALMSGIDLMQVSTIHSFCGEMLRTLPYESRLGPEFTVEEDAAKLAEEFFNETLHREPDRFLRAWEQAGITYQDLRTNFGLLCESDAEPVCETLSDTDIEMLRFSISDKAREIADIYAACADRSKCLPPEDPEIPEDPRVPGYRALFRLLDESPAALANAIAASLDPYASDKAFICKDVLTLLPRKSKKHAEKDDVILLEDDISRMQERIIHSLGMEAVNGLRRDYAAWKRRRRVATLNDLLVCARDMLRDSREARRYFHSRYRCVYVDEMQDTDPVQAELLFFLTTDEAHFDASDWRNCRPVPGSLFLVGDPKQAIYRFRGADISVYKTLTALFGAGAGEVRHLSFNFRSSTEITDFADRGFGSVLNGGEYQAEYTPMAAYKGSSPRARIISYESSRADDPACVAAFINECVQARLELGVDAAHTARYSDFMILTAKKGSTERYVDALRRYGIPCSLAGARTFADSEPIQRAVKVLGLLADPDDEIRLTAVLVTCYGVPLPMLRICRQRTGALTLAWQPAARALGGAGFEPLFSALAELSGLLESARTQPAFTVFEDLCFRSRALWNGECRSDYALLTQFAQEVRKKGCGTLRELADSAAELAQSQSERELLLEEKPDCVRVMNLHKAKGLESEVIILACDSAFRSDAVSHVEHGRLHCGFVKGSGFFTKHFYGPDWDGEGAPGRTEESFRSAEIQRLLYVAATRAKSCLVINTAEKSAWHSLRNAVYELPYGADGEDTDIVSAETDPGWCRALEALESGVSGTGAEAPGTEPQPYTVSVSGLEAELGRRSNQASAQERIYVTPSMLESACQEPVTAESPLAPTLPAPEARPHGPDWGTIVHRVLELCVKTWEFNPDRIADFARQATHETLGDAAELTPAQAAFLLGTHALTGGETALTYITACAAGATAFMSDPAHPLRRLTEGARCFEELPFILRENGQDSPIAAAVRPYCGNAGAQPIELNGIIDLAVNRGGARTIIDYKTDRVRNGESEAEYICRLRSDYSPQLNAYRAVFKQLEWGPVARVCICAVSLGGMLFDV